MSRPPKLPPEQRAELRGLIKTLEGRSFWRPLTQDEQLVLKAAQNLLAQQHSGGPVFRPEPESSQRRSRRPAPRKKPS